ncbi:actin, cytoplasmic-like [Saccostrea echinata]|uniref:actin, cytoplasmic-like n=1 Tax=Saccostrea echinata TaxID=191078 RepID=UPI002A81FCD5|nr:actin, cytoplasmic-like [Saccostrea echinata]
MEENTDSETKTLKIVIIDAGSREMRIGVWGQGTPKDVFPNAVGKLKKMFARTGMNLKNIFFGEEAEEKMKMCDICYPVKNGRITIFDALEKVLTYTFQRNLETNVSEYKIVMKAEKEDRDELLHLLFKTYNPQAILLANQASLSLFAVGCSTGLVVNIGEGTSQVVPIIENRIMQNAVVENLGFNGQSLTEKLLTMLEIDDTPSGHKCAREVKEKYCFVAIDPKAEIENVLSDQVELSDGREIKIKSEKFQCPEVLFEEFRIHEVIVKAIKNCEEDKQKELYKKIVLAGGSTMLKGFPERLEKEIKSLVADDTEINIIAQSDRMHFAWKGGLNVAIKNLFPDNWITREDYEKNEAEIFHSKYI